MSDTAFQDVVRSYWFPISAAIAAAAAWGRNAVTVSTLKSGQKRIEDKLDSIGGQLGEMHTALAQLQTAAVRDVDDIADLRRRMQAVERRR